MNQVDVKDYVETHNLLKSIEMKLAGKNVWLAHTKGMPAFNAFERLHYMVPPRDLYSNIVLQAPEKTLKLGKEILALISEVLNEAD